MPVTRDEIETRLRGVKTRLVLRRLARAAFSALGASALGIALGVMLLDMLPRLVMSSSTGIVPVVVCGIVGLLVGAVYELRDFRMPSLQDCALVMETRLEKDSGALAAALKVAHGSAFAAPVMERAGQDLDRADQAEAPGVIPTWRLVVVPVILLMAGVGVALMLTNEPPESRPASTDDGKRKQTANNWAEVDVGGGRSEAEMKAYREAMGLKETAAQLRQTAATIRDSDLTPAERESAYQKARQTVDDSAEFAPVVDVESLPETLPESQAEREELASRLDDMAGRASGEAEKRLKQSGGVTDSGVNGEFETTEGAEELVPFPEPELNGGNKLAVEKLASQTAARRELARRAVEALERIQNP